MIAIPNPQPLRTAPGLKTWLRYTGQEYIVFVDESFSLFFELTNERGYFCHGAFGIPATEYEAVKREVRPIFDDYSRLLVPELKEFKHTEFRRIPFASRKQLAAELHAVIQSRGGFIEGYYTPAASFILERVREEVMDELPAIPDDYSEIRKSVIERTKAQWEGPGQSDVISQLMLLPFSGLAHMLAALDCTFRIVYDPRQAKEDKAVQAYIDGFGALIHRMTASLEGRFLGLERDRRSEDELGLQIADLVAGETRGFFEENPEFRSFGASPKIITQLSKEPLVTLFEQSGKIWKFGAATRMPTTLQRRFFIDDLQGRTVLPEFTDLLASGVLICYSTWGTPRYVMVYEKLFLDHTDS